MTLESKSQLNQPPKSHHAFHFTCQHTCFAIMSDLQKNVFKSRILKQEQMMKMAGVLPISDNEEEEEESDPVGELGNMGPPPSRLT